MLCSLPTEIKLNILSQAEPEELNLLASSSEENQHLVSHIINKKLEAYLSNNTDQLLISLYSPNNKDSTHKNYYTVTHQTQNHVTTFNIGTLHHRENLLKPLQDLSEKKSQESQHLKQQDHHLDLLLNEDQSVAKISFALLLNNEPINETSIRVNKDSATSALQLSNLAFQYNLSKGEMEPEKGGYDFDINYNYALNFQNFKIDNLSLLKTIEENRSMIIRY